MKLRQKMHNSTTSHTKPINLQHYSNCANFYNLVITVHFFLVATQIPLEPDVQYTATAWMMDMLMNDTCGCSTSTTLEGVEKMATSVNGCGSLWIMNVQDIWFIQKSWVWNYQMEYKYKCYCKLLVTIYNPRLTDEHDLWGIYLCHFWPEYTNKLRWKCYSQMKDTHNRDVRHSPPQWIPQPTCSLPSSDRSTSLKPFSH